MAVPGAKQIDLLLLVVPRTSLSQFVPEGFVNRWLATVCCVSLCFAGGGVSLVVLWRVFLQQQAVRSAAVEKTRNENAYIVSDFYFGRKTDF